MSRNVQEYVGICKNLKEYVSNCRHIYDAQECAGIRMELYSIEAPGRVELCCHQLSFQQQQVDLLQNCVRVRLCGPRRWALCKLLPNAVRKATNHNGCICRSSNRKAPPKRSTTNCQKATNHNGCICRSSNRLFSLGSQS